MRQRLLSTNEKAPFFELSTYLSSVKRSNQYYIVMTPLPGDKCPTNQCSTTLANF